MIGKEEYTQRPVPKHARLGFVKPALDWAGFTYAYWSNSSTNRFGK